MPPCRSATRATSCARSIPSTGSSRRTSSPRRTSRTRARAWWVGCTRCRAAEGESPYGLAASVPKTAAMLLSDTLVIDATERLGWLAGRILADLGADVVKLERPGSDRGSPAWRAFNVNKRVLEVDPESGVDR